MSFAIYNRRSTKIAAAVGTILMSASAFAAQQADVKLEEVVVTAGKIEKPVREMTHSVTVVGEEQIEAQSFTDVTEILRQQSGIEFKQVGGPGQFNYLKLRGLGSENVLIILDGVKINGASNGNTRNLLSQLSPDTIESIEIVRGPQASLYGANATAGVIVIKTKSGAKRDVNFGVEGGSLNWAKYIGSWRDSSQLGDGKLLYSANLSRTESDNIHKYEYFDDQSGQVKLAYEAARWQVGASWWKVDNDFGYAELDEASATTAANYWSFQTPDPDQHSETGQDTGTAYFDFHYTDRLKQSVRVGTTRTFYSIHDRADGLLGYQQALVNIPANSTGNSTAVPAGGVVPIYDTTTTTAAFYKDERDLAEYNLVYSGQIFSLLGGLDYEEQSAEQWGSYGTVNTEDSQWSMFVNGDLKLLEEKLILSVGVRQDDYESWGTHSTGNVGFAWQLSSAFNLYANYGTSFKPATMSQLFNPQYGVPTISPETGETAEIGLRSNWLQGDLTVEAAYWDTQLDDVIYFNGTAPNPRRPSGFGQYDNGAEGKTSGVEFKTAYQLTSALGLYGNYTYTDAQNRAVNGPWLRTVQIADNKANVGANYRFDRITLGANIYYSGPRLRWAGDLETAGYTRVDVSGRYQLTKGFTLFGRIENLLDRDYLDELGYAETGMYSIFGAEYKFF